MTTIDKYPISHAIYKGDIPLNLHILKSAPCFNKIATIDSYPSWQAINACEMNYRTIVRLLLSYGADVNHRRDNKSTPLFMVCCKGYASIVTMLLIRNADLNICQNDVSPLFAACNNGCVDRHAMKIGGSIIFVY
jgi:hypothetical protein